MNEWKGVELLQAKLAVVHVDVEWGSTNFT